MAATTNRRFTELYRNSTVYESKQAAITGLYNHALINSLKDGEPVLARYMAYFAWNASTKQYILYDGIPNESTFTRILSNETSEKSTKEYIVGDYINVTLPFDTKSYKCTAIPSTEGAVAVPVETYFTNTTYFTEIVTNNPQYIKTIRVIMGIATVFEDTGNTPSFKKSPPKGRLTIFEEDDAIREMINKASISSPDGTINISDAVSGKEIEVNLGTSLVKNTTTGVDKGKIDVNFDNRTIKQYSSSHSTLPNKLYVNHGSTLVESSTSGEVGKLDVRTGTSLKVSNGGSDNPDAGTIDVNIDDVTIKQNTTDSKLYVNVNPSYGLESDSSDGIKVRLGEALAFRTGDSTASNNGKIDVKYDDNTIGLNNSNQLIVNFHSGTMERKSHSSGGSTVYDGWGVKHDITILDNANGIHVNIDNNTLISDPSTGAISVNSASTSIFGENAIKIENHTTGGVVDGKTVKLDIDTTTNTGDPNVLSQSNAGLKVNLNLRLLTEQELATLSDSNIKEAYKLVGNAGSSETQIGSVIKIYKDSSLYSVYLGHVDDRITSPTNPVVISGTGSEALCFIYQKSDGTYELVAIDVESFLQESEFKDGLTVNSSTHEVSVKLWNGLDIHSITGENGAIEAKIGNGIQFGSGTDGTKPMEVRLGSGLSFDEGTEQSPITDGVRPIKVNIGYGLVMDSNNIKVNLGTGLGFDASTGNEGKIYVNYNTIGAANRPVYWDGVNHTPVQIDYEINKSVPANAVFTDTTYSSGNEITIDSTNNHINHDVKLTGGFTPTTSSTTISGWGASGSVKIPVLNINQYGHATNASEATLSITFPEAKIIDNVLVWPDYTTTHLSPAWQTVITENAIALDTPYDTAFNKLDKKIKGLADELINAESVWSQAIEDEPRYFAKSSSGASVTAMTATLVDSRNFAIENNKPINGTKVDVYFSTAHTTESATLNINNTGAFPLLYNGSNFDTTLIQSGTTLALVFDKEYNNNTGCYRVVGGVGSGSGSTNGITHVNGGNGTVVTKNYTEVIINSAGTIYTSNWFNNAQGTAVITPVQNVVYRVITNGNYYNMAYTWNGSRYVLSTSIEETVAARLGNGLVFGTGTDGQKPIEINLAANMIPEGSTSGSATEISNLGTPLKFTSEGKLAMENTWDCGTY